MKIIKNWQIIDDPWVKVEDSEPLPHNHFIITLSRWKEQWDSFVEFQGSLGVMMKNTVRVADVANDLSHFEVIALEFPSFKDGRALSQARQLRERYKYKKELRAIGDVLRDQLVFMWRCGIDTFELRSDQDLEEALTSFHEITVTYQTHF